ncbi:MAG: hypothetical protein K8R63_02490 [Bacteroidales bacterium]|nr:hypothetical protein [Bacteroidales bacterium]
MKKTLSILLITLATIVVNAQQPESVVCVECPGGSTSYGGSIIGPNNTANGGIAIGSYSNATGGLNSNSISIGTNVEASGPLSFVIGEGGGSQYRLVNGTPQSLMIGFNSKFPTLFIERAPSSDLYYGRTGKVGIGNVTNPEAKLHIRADAEEDANLFLEPTNWEGGKTADIYLGNVFNRISAGSNRGIEFYSESKFFFENGPIGVGTDDPQSLLHLYANEGQTAAIFVEPGYWGLNQQASVALGNFQHSITGSYDQGLVFNTGSNFLFKHGNVGMGEVIEPLAKLHIKGGENETPNIFIEPFRFETDEGVNQAGLFLGDFEHGVAYNSNSGLIYLTANYHLFQGGNVGIGTFEPAALFHVQDMEGDFLYDQSRAIISSNGYSASYSLVTGIGEQWDISHLIFDHTLNLDHTLNFKYNDVVHMAATQEEGLFVHNNLTVCDLDHGNPYSYPPGSIHVIHNQTELDKKAAEFVTHEGGRIFFVPKVGNFGYNKLSREGDVGIFWSNTTSQTTEGGRLIIAPHYSGSENIYSGIFMTHEGNVGIHVSEPSARLDVKNRLQISGWDPDSIDPKSFIIKSTQDTEVFVIRPSGETFIANKLWAQEVEVVADVWSDFVFSESYKLRPLKEVEGFILENKHLPDVPSEKEIKEDGLNLGEMDAILLQKIEELTLYIIEQEKIIEALSQEVELIKSTSQ